MIGSSLVRCDHVAGPESRGAQPCIRAMAQLHERQRLQVIVLLPTAGRVLTRPVESRKGKVLLPTTSSIAPCFVINHVGSSRFGSMMGLSYLGEHAQRSALAQIVFERSDKRSAPHTRPFKRVVPLD